MSTTKNSIIVTLAGALFGGLLGNALFNNKPKYTVSTSNSVLLPARDGSQRVPVRYMINYLHKHLAALRKYHLGVDRLSETGFMMVIKHLEHYEKDIDEGPISPNPIWGILAEYAEWFTVFEYQLLRGLAYHTMGVAPPAKYLRK